MSISVNHNSLILLRKNVVNSSQKPPLKKPDDAVLLLQICKKVEELVQVQALLVKTSLIKNTLPFGRLLQSFSSMEVSDSIDYARKLFDSINFPRNSFIYNTMIKGYLKIGNPREAFVIYLHMVCDCDGYVCPDDYTFTFVFSACLKLKAWFEGKQAHAQMIKSPVQFKTHSWNSLMSFYTGIEESGSAILAIFEQITHPDVVSYNCLLDGYVKSGDLKEAEKVFDKMPQRDVMSWTSMLMGCVNAGLIDEASDLFNKMPEKNTVSWSALINGYVRTGSYVKALEFFKMMQFSKIEMDKVTMTIILSACANLGALDQGRWIHAYTEYNKIKIDAKLSTALINMYSKCGRIDIASQIFQKIDNKKVYVWNAMLGGLAMHSLGKKAVKLFYEMIGSNIEPNEITFLCVLSSCNHSGLVNDGLRIFRTMITNHNLQPSIEHYGCLVDLLSRSGLLNDAIGIVENMPMKADANVWRAVLNGCKLHRNFELGEKVGRILIEREPLNEANYVLLSNVYASSNQWEQVGKLRKEMKARGLAKTPGCSSVEINRIFHEFAAGDYSHSKSEEIYKVLNKLVNHMAQYDPKCE